MIKLLNIDSQPRKTSSSCVHYKIAVHGCVKSWLPKFYMISYRLWENTATSENTYLSTGFSLMTNRHYCKNRKLTLSCFCWCLLVYPLTLLQGRKSELRPHPATPINEGVCIYRCGILKTKRPQKHSFVVLNYCFIICQFLPLLHYLVCQCSARRYYLSS